MLHNRGRSSIVVVSLLYADTFARAIETSVLELRVF